MNISWKRTAPLAVAAVVALGGGLVPATAADEAANIIGDAAKTADASFCGTKENHVGHP
jgi:hypothetical protein